MFISSNFKNFLSFQYSGLYNRNYIFNEINPSEYNFHSIIIFLISLMNKNDENKYMNLRKILKNKKASEHGP